MKGIQNTNTSNFSAVMGNNRSFSVPKFQRDYSWETEQWDDLWQDIVTMIEEHDEHYMGYLVLQTKDDKHFYIIDGQQRFTTIILLILAAIKNIKRLIENGIDSDSNERRVKNLLNLYIGKEDPVTLEYDNVLELNRNNNPYFKDYIVKMGELRVRNLKATEKLMKRCFEFYDQKLKGRFSTGQDYASFIQNVVDNLYFTQIVVNDEMNAFRVFETLNARGVQLSSSDLLKNYLFSLVDRGKTHQSYIEVLENKWSRLTDNIRAEKLPEFLRYYWNTKHKSIRSKDVFKTIRSEIKIDSQVFELMNELIDYSDIYMALGDKNDEMWKEDMDVQEYIGLLRLFGLKQPYSLLMAAKKSLDNNSFKKLLKTVIVICFRYNVICDKNPNDQELPFNNMAMVISMEKRADYSLLNPVIVDDSVFENAFREKSFPYNSRNAKIIRYILGKIEYFKGQTLNVKYDDENASIEHVIPQLYDENWNVDEDKASRLIFRLGNTCLLEKQLNRELQNDSFDDKKKVYARSKYYYAGRIAEESSWDEDKIIKYQSEMAHTVSSIWHV